MGQPFFCIYSELNTHRIRICLKYMLLRYFPAVESEGNYKTHGNNKRMCSTVVILPFSVSIMFFPTLFREFS